VRKRGYRAAHPGYARCAMWATCHHRATLRADPLAHPGMTNWHCRDLTGALCRIRATPGGAGARGLPSIQAMPDTEITEECRALIASVFEPPSGRRLPNGNWRTEIDTATWQWLQRLRLQGESISDCIIRIVIIALHRRGLQ